MFKSIEYDEPVFRPPGEANSLIFQVTHGCSWNKCAFCDMYATKKFTVKKQEEIEREIRVSKEWVGNARKIFLADGNAMVLSFERLMHILLYIKQYFPKFLRVSAYALPSDILAKSDEELQRLYDAGLKLLYIGIESGDDEVLARINKSETADSTVQGLLKAQKAGMECSLMVINGLGGKKYSTQHALGTAHVLNQIQPHFLSTLVLSFPFGEDHYRSKFKGEYIPMNTLDLFLEMQILIENLNLRSTIFRSDHASNYLVLKGILGKDKTKMLEQIDFAINHPSFADLKKEWQRGL